MKKVIDLFAGAGGFSLGFIKSGFDVVQAIEYDASIAETYKNNHPYTQLIVDDIKNINLNQIHKEADVIIGGPPCQGFSMAGARIRNGFIDDPRNYLFKYYIDIVKAVKPKIFIMENVKGLLTMQNGEVYSEILRIFSDSDMMDGHPYKTMTKIVKGVEFGIPQKRERVIIIGIPSENDIELEEMWDRAIQMVKKNNKDFFDRVTVEDAISNLPKTTLSGKIKNVKPLTKYQKRLSSDSEVIHNHVETKHSKIAIERMKKIKPGENFTSLDEKIKSVHSGSYGRLDWDKPSPTITTRFDTPAGGRFTHPELNRTLTPREAARIQSFPDDFVFYGNKSSITTQIGNAVPPKISYFLAQFTKLVYKEGNYE